jgi:hypothetical protein
MKNIIYIVISILLLTSCTDSTNARLSVTCPCEVTEIKIHGDLYYVTFTEINNSGSKGVNEPFKKI